MTSFLFISNRADQIQIEDVFVGENLFFQLGQRFFKGSLPEFMVPQGGHNRDIAGDKFPENKRKLSHLTRPDGVPRDNHDIG